MLSATVALSTVALGLDIIFNTEVKKQLGKVIKVVRSDRGGEYYGKHGTIGKQMRLFSKYLQECGIVVQYIMLGSPKQNSVPKSEITPLRI